MKQLGGAGMPQDAGYQISRRISFTRPPGWSKMREEEYTWWEKGRTHHKQENYMPLILNHKWLGLGTVDPILAHFY
jgi:hypothetical protein